MKKIENTEAVAQLQKLIEDGIRIFSEKGACLGLFISCDNGYYIALAQTGDGEYLAGRFAKTFDGMLQPVRDVGYGLTAAEVMGAIENTKRLPTHPYASVKLWGTEQIPMRPLPVVREQPHGIHIHVPAHHQPVVM